MPVNPIENQDLSLFSFSLAIMKVVGQTDANAGDQGPDKADKRG
jgi:hypothetical protein